MRLFLKQISIPYKGTNSTHYLKSSYCIALGIVFLTGFSRSGMRVVAWTGLIWLRLDIWRALVKAVMDLRVP
jgi:hypothetical protein